MRYDGHGASYEDMKRDRLERLAESRKVQTNERERAEDDRNRERTAQRKAKKEQVMNEEKEVEFQEGGLLQSDYEIKAEDVMKLANTQERIVKKEKVQEMEMNEDEIRAEVYADIRAALKVLEEFPELVRLVVSKDER